MFTDSYEMDESEWEPEGLPLTEQLESPRPTPRHDDAESDQVSRVIVIDLA